MLLPFVVLLELGGGLGLIDGYKPRGCAWALAIFTIITAMIFHNNLSDQVRMITFMKNFAMAGGLLILAGHGSGFYSPDKMFKR